MNGQRISRISRGALVAAVAFGALATGAAVAYEPDPFFVPDKTWDAPAPAQFSTNLEKLQGDLAAGDSTRKGISAGLEQSGKLADVAGKALDFSKTLSATDKRLDANYEPPGAPGVPSKCMENKACRPCFTEAYAKVNKTRKALEKVRAHYDYTHRLTTSGVALMQSMGGVGGGVAGLGVLSETTKVNDALDGFDTVVSRKNAELLARLQSNLKEVSTCEAKYYKNDDWYDRYGYIYYQFMFAHYGYVQAK